MTSTTTLEAELPLTSIEKHPKNPRHRAIADPEMVESVKVQGLIQPVVVAPHPTKDGAYVLIAGHRRLDACKKAKTKTAPAIVRHDLVTEGAQLEAMIIENCHRVDLTAIEEAEGYAQLELIGYKAPGIAAAVGRDVKTVRSRLKLLKLAASTKKKLHAGQLSIDDAGALAEFVDDPAATSRLEKSLSTTNFKYDLQRERKQRKAMQEIATQTADLLADGATEVVVKSGQQVWSVTDADKGPVRIGSTHSEEPAEHKDCLGFAITNDTWSGPALHLLCMNPSSHADALDEEERADAEERQREADERKAKAAAAEIAKTLRLESLVAAGGVSITAGVGVVRELLPHLIHTLTSDLKVYQQAVGVPEEDRWEYGDIYYDSRKEKSKHVELFAQHVEEISQWSDAKVVTALIVALSVSPDHHLGAFSHRPDRLGLVARYIDLLEAVGHEFCDVDADLRAALQPAPTEDESDVAAS